MTELYIQGKAVALPAEFALSMRAENPLVTKNGTYSLDLTLSLEEHTNAKLFQHMSRMHSYVHINGWRCRLVCDGHMLMNGTVAFVSNTDKDITIQLLSGNSELNFFVHNGKLIADLNMGEMTDADAGVDYVLPQVLVDGIEYNSPVDEPHPDDEHGWETYVPPVLMPQPLLLPYMERVIRSMGYDIEFNELRDDSMFPTLFFLNNIVHYGGAGLCIPYNDLMQGWKVVDFLEACEMFFCCIFDIDPVYRRVRIFRAARHNPLGLYTIESTLDDYERSAVDVDYSDTYINVRYDFPPASYFKLADLNDSTRERCDVEEVPTFEVLRTQLGITGLWIDKESASQYYGTLKMWHVAETDTSYVVDRMNYSSNAGKKEVYYLRKVNHFGRVEGVPGANFMKIPFFPAETVYADDFVNCPAVDFAKTSQSSVDSGNFLDVAKNGVQDADAAPRRLVALAILLGTDPSGEIETATDFLRESGVCYETVDPLRRTLRLDGEYGMYARHYASTGRMDYSKEYRFRFVVRELPDVRADFLIGGKLFACKELEYSVSARGVNMVVQGVFYEVKG